MVSVGVSKLGYTSLIFVDPGVNGAYYHDAAVTTACHTSGLWWVLHPSARQCPSARACETINLLERETPAFIPNSLDVTTSIQLTKMSGQCSSESTRQKCRKWKIWGSGGMSYVWFGLQQNVIDDAIDQWCRRLHNCIRARGHFEYSVIVTHKAVKLLLASVNFVKIYR